MKPIVLDVVIPSLNEDGGTVAILESLLNQKDVEIKNIILPITLKFENPKNDLHEIIKNYAKVKYFDVKPEEFSHSLTREKAIREYCESNLIVLMSNDAKPMDEHAVYNLAKDVENKKCAYASGRQISVKNSLDKYFRERNYSTESYFVTKEDIERMQIMAFHSSDVFSCLDREIFIKINGYQGLNLITNEDMYYSYCLLQNGYSTKYAADAVVEHTHSNTLKEIYDRYYSIGEFYKQVKVFDGYKTESSGFSVAFSVLGKAFKHFDIKSIFLWLPNMASRYLGFKKGSK